MNTNEKNVNEKNLGEEVLEEVSGGLPYRNPQIHDENRDSNKEPVSTGTVAPFSNNPLPVVKKD